MKRTASTLFLLLAACAADDAYAPNLVGPPPVFYVPASGKADAGPDATTAVATTMGGKTDAGTSEDASEPTPVADAAQPADAGSYPGVVFTDTNARDSPVCMGLITSAQPGAQPLAWQASWVDDGTKADFALAMGPIPLDPQTAVVTGGVFPDQDLCPGPQCLLQLVTCARVASGCTTWKLAFESGDPADVVQLRFQADTAPLTDLVLECSF